MNDQGTLIAAGFAVRWAKLVSPSIDAANFIAKVAEWPGYTVRGTGHSRNSK